MKKKFWTIFLFMMIVLQLSCLTAFAKTTTQKADLNGDKKKETVKIVEGSSVKIYVNGKQMLQMPKYTQIRIVDFNKKDKYREIAALRTINTGNNFNGILTLYRYNGKKLTKYVEGDDRSRNNNVLSAGHCYGLSYFNDFEYGIEFKGDGYLRTDAMFSLKKYPGVFSNFTAVYKNLNGKLVLDSKKYHSAGEWSDVDLSKAPYNMSVYQYPRSTSNRKLFTLKKNYRFCIRQIVINSQKTYVQIKDSKSKKCGWLIFATKDIKISEPGMY